MFLPRRPNFRPRHFRRAVTFCPYLLSRQAEGERPVSAQMKLENEDNEL